VPPAVNLVANLSFTPILFDLRGLPLADILVVLGTIVWSMVAVWPHA
jgi:tryptophan-rich sensory protein